MIGILCEKPSAARNFAKALGGIKGTYNGEQYIIVNALGHLYGYVDPDRMVDASLATKYKTWSVENLPWKYNELSWRRAQNSKVSDVVKTLKMVLPKVDTIVIAGDVDPTGEGFLLCAEIIEELKLTNKNIERMYFYDESEKELQKGFKNRVKVNSIYDFGEYKKALYRMRFDYLTQQETRIATKLGDGQTLLRCGRFKSFVVMILGSQFEKIKNYQKVPFYEWRFRDDNGVVYSKDDAEVYKNKQDLPIDLSNVSSNVIIDSKTIKTSPPPKLLDMASLSSLMSKQYKPKDVLKVYQLMYQEGYVSYPRTSDSFVSPEQFNELLPLVDSIAALVGVDKLKLTHRQPRKTHVKTGGAHGANRPGKKVPLSKLEIVNKYGDIGWTIYEILSKNYLSILGEDYRYERQVGHLEKYPDYIGAVNVAVDMGYKSIFSDVDDETDGDLGLGSVANSFIHEGFPPKPTAPTMKWLMKQLEKHDVGTGATRTSIYAEMSSGKTALITDTKGKIKMTESGEMCYRLLPDTHIASLTLTKQVYDNMKLIEDGKLNLEQELINFENLIRDDINTIAKNAINMRKDLNISMKKNDSERYSGIFNGKAVSFKKSWSNYEFSDEECERLLKGEIIVLKDLKSSKGATYSIKGRLNDNLEFKGKKYCGFENLGFADSDSLPKKWCNHVFTEDERTLLEAGESVYIEGFVSQKGNTFNAIVKFVEVDGAKKIVPEF